jgi:hypothetical protein
MNKLSKKDKIIKDFFSSINSSKDAYINNYLESNKYTFYQDLKTIMYIFNKYIHNSEPELIINVFDKKINLDKKLKLILYGYTSDNKFFWIKNYNKVFHNYIKNNKFLNKDKDLYQYFFNTDVIKFKNNINKYTIPFIIFKCKNKNNIIEFDIANNCTMFGVYTIIE